MVILRAMAAKGRRERTFDGKELVLDFLFPGHFFRSGPGDDDPRLPDELFSFIAGYYGDGGMTAEEEAALAAEAAARAAPSSALPSASCHARPSGGALRSLRDVSPSMAAVSM